MDISTLSIVSVFLSAMLSFSLFFCYRYMFDGMIKGVNHISFALFLLALSILPISLGYTQTSCAVVFVSNSLYAIAVSLLFIGIAYIRAPKKNIILICSIISIITILTFAYFTLVTPSVSARIKIRSFFIIIMSIIGIYINRAGQVQDNKAPLLLLNAILMINAIAMSLRLIWAYTEIPVIHYLSISEVHKMAYILMIVTSITISFTVFWILTERLISKIHSASVTDELTKLYNRKGLEEFLATRLPIKRDSCVSIILADIDKFKRINDTYGHHYGDLVIKNFSTILREQCRSDEVCVRYGGDEFLIILLNSPKDTSMKIAHRIQKVVAAQSIDSITYSVSFGLTEMTANDNWDRLIRRVDSALYTAKANGRDCLVQT